MVKQRQRKQCGGASDEYCPLCGLPFSRESGINDLDWITEAYGFDTVHGVVWYMNNYDPERRQCELMPIAYQRPAAAHLMDEFEFERFEVLGALTEEDMEGARVPYGYAIHVACVEALETILGLPSGELPPEAGRIITFNAALLPEYRDTQQQYFNYETAFRRYGRNFAEVPDGPDSATWKRIERAITTRLRQLLGAAAGSNVIEEPNNLTATNITNALTFEEIEPGQNYYVAKNATGKWRPVGLKSSVEELIRQRFRGSSENHVFVPEWQRLVPRAELRLTRRKGRGNAAAAAPSNNSNRVGGKRKNRTRRRQCRKKR